MRKETKIILNELYTMAYIWLEKEITLNAGELQKLFTLLLKNDKRYFRYCPEAIEDNILTFEKMINKLALKEEEMKDVLLFINAIITVYEYEKTPKKATLEMDKLYYNAVLAEFFIRDTNSNKNLYTKFKEEFFQIGVQIANFYKISKEDIERRDLLKSLIKGKTEELFNRYELSFNYPTLCII